MKPLAEYFKRTDRYARIDSPEPVDTFYSLTDDAPEWLADAVREAHEDEGPNDWRYETCYRIACQLDEYAFNASLHTVGACDIADSLTDVYTADLLAWLVGHLGRVEDVDGAIMELGAIDFVRLVAFAQYCVIERMATILATAYVENVTDDE